jgi:hypothetical protein
MNHSILKARFNNIFVLQVHKHLRWKSLPKRAEFLLLNVSVYPNENVLKSNSGKVSVKYLPPNVTTLIQPMDPGTIATMKRQYSQHILQKYVDKGNDLNVSEGLCAVPL